GSGSAALGLWRGESFLEDGEYCGGVAQPGGVIEVCVSKQRGEVRSLTIGGKVSLKSLSVPCP
ncbi:MAG: hypothetical protein LBD13_02610, partial [Spirochaetaceae bacterium]|nr:hypothetical protein [Spirochaetaceae bacterium]